jgi:thymidylate kinase
MYVVCIEGCHGCGKTTLVEQAKARGEPVIEEGFMGMPSFTMHPQNLVVENIWIARWFERVLNAHKEFLASKRPSIIYYADRSPYSPVFYTRSGGHILESLVSAQLEQLKEHGIHVITVYIRLDSEVLWDRIQARLREEPIREIYGEGSREVMDKVVAFYESRRSTLWDLEIQDADQLQEVLRVAIKDTT